VKKRTESGKKEKSDRQSTKAPPGNLCSRIGKIQGKEGTGLRSES